MAKDKKVIVCWGSTSSHTRTNGTDERISMENAFAGCRCQTPQTILFAALHSVLAVTPICLRNLEQVGVTRAM